MLPLGLTLLVLGLVWTVWMVLSAAWPSVVPWAVLGLGAVVTCVALQLRGSRRAWLGWVLLGAAAAAVLGGWLLG
jgi:uncharacterized membrane protein